MPTSEIDKSLYDEYGALERELLPWKIKLRRMEDLAKLIRSQHDGANPEASIDCVGNVYRITLGPASMQSFVPSMHDVFKALGKKRFIQSVTITIKALEAIDAGLVAKLTRKVRTGWRPILVSMLPDSEPAKKAA